MTDAPLNDLRLVSELRSAALQAQELSRATRAIESCVSALHPDTPELTIIETSLLVRAAALQIAALVHGLVAHSERLALLVGGVLPRCEGVPLPASGKRGSHE